MCFPFGFIWSEINYTYNRIENRIYMIDFYLIDILLSIICCVQVLYICFSLFICSFSYFLNFQSFRSINNKMPALDNHFPVADDEEFT